MREKDWFEIGEQIRDMVQSAVDSKDFQKLNQTVSRTINEAVDSAKKGARKAGEVYQAKSAAYYEKYPNKEIKGNFKNANYSTQIMRGQSYDTTRFSDSPAGRIAGPVMTFLGFIIGGIFGMAAFTLFLVGSLTGVTPVSVSAGLLGVLFLGGMAAGGVGLSIWGRVRRFKKYIKFLGKREYCDVQELCRAVGKSKSAVVKDLKSMIGRGMFLQGHLDEKNTCLMVTQHAYEQYLAAQRELERRKQEEEKRQKQSVFSSDNEECAAILQEGSAYIQRIHRANDEIPDAVMSEKLARLEMIMTKIFRQVEQEPQMAQDLHKFMKYYLPTTTKLIDAYQEMEEQNVEGEHITGAKKEIEDTLDTINEAFENLLDRFFQEKAWDISSDISVMKSMLAQEGLVEQEFKMPTSTKG